MPRNTPSEVCGPGIAADVAAFDRKPGDERRLPADLDHVGDAHADVFGGDVAAAQIVDRLAEACSISGVLVRFSSARITALPPPSGSPAMAFL